MEPEASTIRQMALGAERRVWAAAWTQLALMTASMRREPKVKWGLKNESSLNSMASSKKMETPRLYHGELGRGKEKAKV